MNKGTVNKGTVSTLSPPVAAGTEVAVRAGRRNRQRTRRLAVGLLAVLVVAAYCASLMFGDRFYSPGQILQVISGEQVRGASFTVGELRLPRATAALLAGVAFGLGGITFQTMLHNALASPDIIGISQGASAAAVIGIVVFGLGPSAVSVFAIVGALATALAVYALSWRDGVAGTRLILIGIGLSAMLHSVVSWVMVRAAQWDLQTAMRWMTGSVNSVTWDQIVPLALAMAVLVPLLLGQSRNLLLMQHGDDAAHALGVRVERTRVVAIVAAVGLIAFATSVAGPVAFVAFLSGPIAARIVGAGRSLMVPAALVGALLVLLADFAGQYAFANRFPVGVVTGVLGAPYLVYLLVRTNRSGGSL